MKNEGFNFYGFMAGQGGAPLGSIQVISGETFSKKPINLAKHWKGILCPFGGGGPHIPTGGGPDPTDRGPPHLNPGQPVPESTFSQTVGHFGHVTTAVAGIVVFPPTSVHTPAPSSQLLGLGLV